MKKERLMELAGIQLNENINKLTPEELKAIKHVIKHAWTIEMDQSHDEEAAPLGSAFKKLFGEELEY